MLVACIKEKLMTTIKINVSASSPLVGFSELNDNTIKLYIVVLKDCGNNLVQAKDNNANGINEMAFMLWDIMTSCEIKHIW